LLPGGVFVEDLDAATDYDASEATDQQFIAGAAERGSSMTPARNFSLEHSGRCIGLADREQPYVPARCFAEGNSALVTLREVGTQPGVAGTAEETVQ
jgi:hypothetical protein